MAMMMGWRAVGPMAPWWVGLVLVGLCLPAAAARQREGTEWFTSYAYNATDTHLPRVLLVGDSICAGYQSLVRDKLAGAANVSYLATSKCVSDPTYLKLLSLMLGEAPYQVIHFNNGLHSLDTDRQEWVAGLRAAFELLKTEGHGAKIVWATSTPLKDPALTAKAQELNALAAPLVQAAGFAVDDLFALMDPLDRAKYWTDTFHYGEAGRDMEAKQVADSVRPLLAGFIAQQAPAAASTLKNGDFESDGGWNLYPPKAEAGSLALSTDAPHSGQRAAQVTSLQPGLQFYQYAPALEAGGSYALSFWARADKPAKVTVNVRTQKPPYQFYGNKAVELTTTWQQFTTEFVLPAEYKPGEHVLFFNLGEAGVYGFDDLKVERK